MLIYLDTKDLINTLEKSKPCSPSELQAHLRRCGHELVVSFFHIMEISAPLLESSTQNNVMTLLNRLEILPLRFINDGRIPLHELKEALNAFSEKREYSSINPFVNQFDEAISIEGSLLTRYILNIGLAEIVFTLWCEDPKILMGGKKYSNELRRVFAVDRSLSRQPSLQTHFVKKIERDLALYKLLPPQEGVNAFAQWIFQEPSRCPGLRLGYETYHKMLKNKTYIPIDSDMVDLYHIRCLPYINRMTLDRRTSAYVSQASRGLGTDYESRIVRNFKEMLAE